MINFKKVIPGVWDVYRNGRFVGQVERGERVGPNGGTIDVWYASPLRRMGIARQSDRAIAWASTRIRAAEFLF